ncbi:MAG TPA: YihY/virulence factor BrkB family protein [Tepidisphaeraceae bacterium]|nr:YihY/virulence factor BrkB family protein [Tepidisphaeraceae bacterium]
MSSPTFALLRRAYCEWSSHNSLRLAAAMAFYTMLSLAPMLVVALTVLSVVVKHDVQGKIQDRANFVLGNAGGEVAGEILAAITRQGAHGVIATIISFVVALASGSSLFVNMQEAMNDIWDVRPRRDAGLKAFLWPRLISVVVLFAAGAMLLASFAASWALTVVTQHLPAWLSWASFVGEIALSVAIAGLLFACAYKLLPSVEVKWTDVWLGAAMSAVLFVAGKYALVLYFRFVSIRPFGAAGSLAALLIWVYLSSAIIFFGTAFTRAFAERNGKRVPPDKFGVKYMTERHSTCETA